MYDTMKMKRENKMKDKTMIEGFKDRLSKLGTDYDEYVRFREDLLEYKKKLQDDAQIRKVDKLVYLSLIVWDSKAETITLY